MSRSKASNTRSCITCSREACSTKYPVRLRRGSLFGVAWVAGYYGFRNTQEAARREAKRADELYRLERRREQDQVQIEPLRKRLADLDTFIQAVSRYYLVINSELLKDELQAAEADLVHSSSIVYQYIGLTDAFGRYYPIFANEESYFRSLIDQTGITRNTLLHVLEEKLEESRLRIQEELETVTTHAADDGPIVKGARRLQHWLRNVSKSQ